MTHYIQIVDYCYELNDTFMVGKANSKQIYVWIRWRVARKKKKEKKKVAYHFKQ